MKDNMFKYVGRCFKIKKGCSFPGWHVVTSIDHDLRTVLLLNLAGGFTIAYGSGMYKNIVNLCNKAQDNQNGVS